MKWKGILLLLVFALPCTLQAEVDLVFVDKSKRKMYLLEEGKVVGRFKVSLGAKPRGHKRKRGDGRTPEGSYTLGAANLHSEYYKSVAISYPNAEDRARAKKWGHHPGGDIMVHGQRNYFGWMSYMTQRFDWTNGCIALRNKDMDEFIERVPIGTEIRIHW